MEVRFLGVRGSYPVARADQYLFGGHTTSFYIQSGRRNHLIIDAGTGIISLGKELMNKEFGKGRGKLAILLTHTHWDHILGFPYFSPLYTAGNEITIITARLEYSDIDSIFDGLFKSDIFPVPFKELKANLNLMEFDPPQSFTLDDFHIQCMQINHNNVTLGFRVECDGKCFTTLTDNAIIELARMGDGFPDDNAEELDAFIQSYRIKQKEFAWQSDVLVCDTHFTQKTIRGKEHWGHSTPDEAIRLAQEIQPKYLILHHHDPETSDNQVFMKERYVRTALANDPIQVYAAYEGLTLSL